MWAVHGMGLMLVRMLLGASYGRWGRMLWCLQVANAIETGNVGSSRALCLCEAQGPGRRSRTNSDDAIAIGVRDKPDLSGGALSAEQKEEPGGASDDIVVQSRRGG
jgi:hypothetical protein